jgi:hypothetical protein
LHEGNAQNKVCPKYDNLLLTLTCHRDSDIICTKDQSVQLYRSKGPVIKLSRVFSCL